MDLFRVKIVLSVLIMLAGLAGCAAEKKISPTDNTPIDSGADGLLELPNEPLPFPAEMALVDEPYLQEFNHTLNEQPEAIDELVALVMPPLSFSDFDRPTMVAPRGLWLTESADPPIMLEMPGAASDVVDAAAFGGYIYLLTENSIYRVAQDRAVALLDTLPSGAQGNRFYETGSGIYILTSTALGFFDGSSLAWYLSGNAPRAIGLDDDALYLADEDSLTAYDLNSFPEPLTQKWSIDLDVGTPAAILTARTLPQALDLVIVGTESLVGYDVSASGASEVSVPLFEAGRVPLAGAVTAIEDSNGGFIVAAEGGAYRIVDLDFGPEYRVYVPERWMPTGEVRDVFEDTSTASGPIYFATSGGRGYMTRQSYTIADKIATMIERIELRHDREGALADSNLTAPGDLSTSVPYDSDNDGGWTCYWVLSECFRYKLTGDEQAKANFDKSLARMLSFRTLTGTDYFLARSVIRIDGCVLDDCDDPDDGEWFLSPDGEWWVKADTSNDEVTSHMFMMGQAYDYCADEQQKQAIVEHVDGIIGGIVEHGYQLIDPQDGACTSYGQFDPDYVNSPLAGALADGGRRAAQMIGALNLAHYLTGKQLYLDAKRELIEQHGYAESASKIGDVEVFPLCAGSGDCDELAYQAFVPLLRYESDPELREMWMTGWRTLYSHLVDQEDAFWDMANAAFEGDNIDLFYSKLWLQRYPTDLVRWQIQNEVRTDTIAAPDYYLTKEVNANFRLRSDGHIFPGDERPNIRHNTPQFAYTGGWGSLRELDGGDGNYPYWLGRYYGFIAEP